MFSSLLQLFLLALVSTVTVSGSPYIVNSSDAKNGQFPYVASIRVNGKHICGGTIVSEKFILTAGHCVKEANVVGINKVTVLTGTISIDDGSGTTSAVDSMFNDDGNGEIPKTDIGLIKLTTPLTWNGATKSIPLAKSKPNTGVYGIIAGWGSTNAQTTMLNNKLQYQNVYISENCTPYNMELTICTNNGPSIGVCYGDSGSPLVYRNEVVGVVSRAVLCGIGFPDVHSSVPQNSDYIQSIMNRYN